MKKQRIYRMTALFLSMLILCTACGGNGNGSENGKKGSESNESAGKVAENSDNAQAQATAMKLVKTEGTVGVADEAGTDVPLVNEMGLYSGYGVDTKTESYAWINLDDVKLTKMDADSKISIQKKDRALKVLVEKGSLFFHVTEPLAEDESLDIRSSDTIVGIRGTCGWVTLDEWTHLELYLLDGEVEYTFQNPDTGEDESVTISAGEKVRLVQNDDGSFSFEVDSLMPEDMPVFVGIESDNEIVRQWMEMFGLTPDFFQEPGETEETEEAEPGNVVLTMPVNSNDVASAIWNQNNETVTIQSNGENATLDLDFITVREGKTLIIDEGIDVRVVFPEDYNEEEEKGANFFINGTMIVRGNLTNDNGMVYVDGGRLEVGGTFYNGAAGEIIVENGPDMPDGDATLIVNGVLENHGSLENRGTVEGTVQ